MIRGDYPTHLVWDRHHTLKDNYGKPITVWEYDLFETPGIHGYVPVQFIICSTASLVDKPNEGDPSLLFVVPLINFACIYM